MSLFQAQGRKVTDKFSPLNFFRSLPWPVWHLLLTYRSLCGLSYPVDWIPLSAGSKRPTEGRTLALAQVNGGSQSFNVLSVNRNLGRWMRMLCIPNQSSIPQVWKQFNSEDRLLPSSNRDRLVDVAEELVKITHLLLPSRGLLEDRYSEREEKREHGRLRTQEETEKAKDIKAALT